MHVSLKTDGSITIFEEIKLRKEVAFMINGSCTKSDLENKYIFWDIDGTLAPYRFNDHVADPDRTNNGMSLEEIAEHIFLTRKPSQHMMKVVYSCGARRNFIMGHCQVQQEMDDKQLWLDKHFPIIRRQDRILTFENISKADSIVEYCAGHRIDLKDIVYVDDVIPFLREAERKGIKSYHISSFLDWDIVNKPLLEQPDSATDAFFNIHNG